MPFRDRRYNFSLPYFETSAATGQNVVKAVELLLDNVMMRMEQSVDKTGMSLARNGKKLSNQGQEVDEAGEGGCGCWSLSYFSTITCVIGTRNIWNKTCMRIYEKIVFNCFNLQRKTLNSHSPTLGTGLPCSSV